MVRTGRAPSRLLCIMPKAVVELPELEQRLSNLQHQVERLWRKAEASVPPVEQRLASMAEQYAEHLKRWAATVERHTHAVAQLEAYATVVPGRTRDSDVARYLKKRMAEMGVTDAWAPEQNPNVNSGPDRGHSHATDRVIQPGDFIQTDFGIKVHGVYCTDIQRFAYVLRPGESAPPPEARARWEKARKGSRIALVGHEPNLGELAARLIGARAPLEFKKGAVCRIDFEVLPPKGVGHLQWFLQPRMLRKLS